MYKKGDKEGKGYPYLELSQLEKFLEICAKSNSSKLILSILKKKKNSN